MESDGYVYGSYWNLGDSYGKDNSPYHPYDHSSWYILHTGMVNFNSEVNYSKSYGMIYNTKKIFNFRSPDTRSTDYICHVFPSDSIEYRYNFYVDYPCGISINSIYQIITSIISKKSPYSIIKKINITLIYIKNPI